MKHQTFTLDEVKRLVRDDGRDLVIFDGKVYDVTRWLAANSHPGGTLIIKHMVGRDATDQMTTHHREEILARYLKMFYVGDMEESERGVTFDRPLSRSFRSLYQKMKTDGLFEPNSWWFGKLYIVIGTLISLSVALLVSNGDAFIGCTIAGTLLGAAWHLSSGLMHDFGHNAVSTDRRKDFQGGLILSNCLTGISIGWWKITHFLHHLVPNDPEHDPHIQVFFY